MTNNPMNSFAKWICLDSGFETLQSVNPNLQWFIRSQRPTIQAQKSCFQTLEFEKKLCLSQFKKQFGLKLPSPAVVHMDVAMFDRGPTFRSSNYNIKTTQTVWPHPMVERTESIPLDLCKKSKTKLVQTSKIQIKPSSSKSHFKARLVCSGLQLISASWLLQTLITILSHKRRNPKATLSMLMRDVDLFMKGWQSACPIKGLRVTATGRLGRRKKGMAQQITYGIGKTPLNAFKEKIDYDQGFVETRFGVIGLKVWLCFR